MQRTSRAQHTSTQSNHVGMMGRRESKQSHRPCEQVRRLTGRAPGSDTGLKWTSLELLYRLFQIWGHEDGCVAVHKFPGHWGAAARHYQTLRPCLKSYYQKTDMSRHTFNSVDYFPPAHIGSGARQGSEKTSDSHPNLRLQAQPLGLQGQGAAGHHY